MTKKINELLSNKRIRNILILTLIGVLIVTTMGVGSALAANDKATKKTTDGAIAEYSQEKNTKDETTKVDATNTTDTKQNNNVDETNNTSNNDSSNNSSNDNNASSNNKSDNSSKSGHIGKDKAKSIALAKVGGGKVVYCYLDYDDGRAEYEVKIVLGNYEYEMDIDAVSGKIRDYDKDRIDYDDDDDDDDYDD